MFRWFQLDRIWALELRKTSCLGTFGGMFRQLQMTLVENQLIFRMSLIFASTLWLLGSVLMYYAERQNPDEGTRSHFATLPLSFWMTALDFTSEAPVNDHSAQALHLSMRRPWPGEGRAFHDHVRSLDYVYIISYHMI